MGHNEHSDNNEFSIQTNTEKDIDIEKLLGSIMLSDEIELIDQIKSWVDRTPFISFMRAVESVVQGQPEVSLIVFSVYNYLYNIAKDLPLNKQSAILAGPSGSGKTETYRCLKRYFQKEIPKLVVDLVDMNQITCEGFSGNNTEFLVQGLKRGRSKGIGILFGDEFDKRISPIYSSHGDNVNREIQGQLLLPIEGCIIDNVDTSKTLFICMGSFNEIREKRNLEKHFGIGIERTDHVKEHYAPITKEDIIALGASFELLGRFGLIVNYGPLSYDAIDRIIDMRLDEISASMDIKVSVNDNMRDFLHKKGNTEFGNRLIESILRDAATRAKVQSLINEIDAEEIVVIGEGKYIIKEADHKLLRRKKAEKIQKEKVESKNVSIKFDPFVSLFGKQSIIENEDDNPFSDSLHELDEVENIDDLIRRIDEQIAAITETEKAGENEDKINKTDYEKDQELHHVYVACKKEDKVRNIAKLIAKKNGDTIKKNVEMLKKHKSVVVVFDDLIDAIIFKTSILEAGGEAWFDART
ncbi:AAA family ATPase [Butyrivibrio sp. AE2032]|uniref:AAA family ATPase n=1 Tax=Butyrivibrio sp. AE2032 TaxID=1458463 RepID=UPI000555D0B1|nr:AAA family ATPase [Butyrivibrio sp. AE2032]